MLSQVTYCSIANLKVVITQLVRTALLLCKGDIIVVWGSRVILLHSDEKITSLTLTSAQSLLAFVVIAPI